MILESPALPVSEGATVTLHCTPETKSFNQFFDFYKDGHCIKRNSTGEITIKRVSKSDEGLYKCSISGGEESLGSWLAVDGEQQKSHHTHNVEQFKIFKHFKKKEIKKMAAINSKICIFVCVLYICKWWGEKNILPLKKTQLKKTCI